MRFTIRDLLWLTTVICLVLGWGLWILSLPRPDPRLNGNVRCGGRDVISGQICLHSKAGLIYGSKIADGKYAMPRVPEGHYTVAMEGDGIPEKYRAAG
jgi:hypothetical protein